jgi:hypothetical protein
MNVAITTEMKRYQENVWQMGVAEHILVVFFTSELGRRHEPLSFSLLSNYK